MNEEDKIFMANHRHIYNQLNMAGTLNIDHGTKVRLAEIIRRNWDGGYLVNLHCGQCVADMVKFAYVQLDKHAV